MLKIENTFCILADMKNIEIYLLTIVNHIH